MSAKTTTLAVIVLGLVLAAIIVPWVLFNTGGSPPTHGPAVTKPTTP
jgi:hypothetical protein